MLPLSASIPFLPMLSTLRMRAIRSFSLSSFLGSICSTFAMPSICLASPRDSRICLMPFTCLPRLPNSSSVSTRGAEHEIEPSFAAEPGLQQLGAHRASDVGELLKGRAALLCRVEHLGKNVVELAGGDTKLGVQLVRHRRQRAEILAGGRRHRADRVERLGGKFAVTGRSEQIIEALGQIYRALAGAVGGGLDVVLQLFVPHELAIGATHPEGELLEMALQLDLSLQRRADAESQQRARSRVPRPFLPCRPCPSCSALRPRFRRRRAPSPSDPCALPCRLRRPPCAS
jgi:hypothetical protein